MSTPEPAVAPAPETVLSKLEELIGPLSTEQREKLGLPPAAPPPTFTTPFERHVTFSAGTAEQSGQAFIVAKLHRTRDISDSCYFVSDPARLEKFRTDKKGVWQPWRPFGELPPFDVVEMYKLRFNPALAGVPGAGVGDGPNVEVPRAERGKGERLDHKALGPFRPRYAHTNFDDNGRKIEE